MEKVMKSRQLKFKEGDKIRNMKVGDVLEIKEIDFEHGYYVTDSGYLLFENDATYKLYDPAEVCIKDKTGNVIGTSTLKLDQENDVWKLNINIIVPSKLEVVVLSHTLKELIH